MHILIIIIIIIITIIIIIVWGVKRVLSREFLRDTKTCPN